MDDAKHAGERLAKGRAAREGRSRGATSRLNTVSRPPEDGRPGAAQANLCAGDVKAAGLRPFLMTRDDRTARPLEHTKTQRKTKEPAREQPAPPCGDLTFDMSGGTKGAKRL